MSRKYNKTFTSLKTVVHDTSILDAQKILVNTDKTNPAERTNLISYIDNSIDPLKNPQDAGLRDIVLGEIIEKTFNVNTFGADLDNATITGFQYSFAHFIADAKLLSLTFPYSYNGSSVNEGYLFVEVCDADLNRLTSAYSENTFGFGSDGSSAVFTFENLILPKEYHIIRFALVADTEKEPDFSNGNNCLSFRSRPLKIGSNVNFDDDDCLIYNGSSTENWITAASVTYETREGGLLEQYPIEINTAVNGTLTEGLTFNTNTVNGALDNASIKGIQYSKEHFVADAHITSIAIPYNYQSGASSTGYLYIEIINEEGIVVNSSYSVESGSFNNSSSGEHTVTFNFSDFYVPENYKLVRLALVTNKTTVPNIVTTENCLSFRARPIKLNNNVNYDDDDCMIYASATNTQNWVVALTVTYNQIVGGVTDDILYNNIRTERLLKDVNNLTAASKTHISNEEAQNKFANKVGTETAINKIGYTFEAASDATGEGESNAIHYAANKIPHNVVIDEVRIPALNNSPKALYLAAWLVNQSDVKTYIGLSDEAVTWSEGGVAIWKFTNNPINVPENYKLELFLAETAPENGANNIPTSSNYIKTYVNYSGSGTIRYGNDWYSGRDVRTTFVKNGIVVNHEERISILEKKAPGDVGTLEGVAKLDEANVFTANNTFNGGMISNGDIVLNGSKLLLANGAAVEIYQGTDIPLPEEGGQNTVSNTNNIAKKYNGYFQPIYLDSNANNNYSTLDFAGQPALTSKEQIIALCKLAGGIRDNYASTFDHDLDIVNAQIGNENEKLIINFNYSFNFDEYYNQTIILSLGGDHVSRYYYFVRNFNNCNLNNLVFLPFEYSNPLYIKFNNCIINNSTIYIKGFRLQTVDESYNSIDYYSLLELYENTLSDCTIKIDNETLSDEYVEAFIQKLSNDNTCTNVKIYSLNDELLFEI